MSKGGKAPAPPDYEAAARAQGQANLEAIRTGAALNRVNQTTPYGSVTYRQVGGTGTPTAPSSTSTFGQNGSGSNFLGAPLSGRAGQMYADILARGNLQPQTQAQNSDQWEQITELSPDQQAILDAQERNQIDMGGIANTRLNQFGNQGPLDFSGQPSRVTGV